MTKADVLKDIAGEHKLLSSQDPDADYLLVERVLADRHAGGDHIRRFSDMFWLYSSGVWAPADNELVRDGVQRTVNAARGGRGDRTLVEAARETGTAAFTAHTWAFVCSHVRGLDTSPDPLRLMELDVDAVVNCRNCEVVFDRDGSRTVRDHDPARMLTHMIDTDYDPEADTAAWDGFMKLMFANADDPEGMTRHLEEVMGYIIQPWRELATVCIMRGEPSAGKTTIGQLLNLMLGQAGANAELSGFNGSDNHALAGLVGKLLLLDEDFKAGGLLPDGFLRRISEAKHMTANPKYGKTFEFVCRAVPFIVSNSWPASRDHTGGLERRALCWDLPAIPGRLRSPAARRALLSPAGRRGALLRWLDGFARLYRRGDWDQPAECTNARERWLRAADSVAMWAVEHIVERRNHFQPRAPLYARYLEWHRASTPGGKPVGKWEFHERMRRRFGTETKRGVAGWHGIEHTGEFDIS